LDERVFDVYLLTLSPDPTDNEFKRYSGLNVRIESLGMSRIEGFFKAKRALERYLNSVQPDIIHSQGIRADSLLASIKHKAPWVLTSRNFPPEDYPAKFGIIQGSLMVIKHFKAMRKCQNVIACSKSIQGSLSRVGIEAKVIQNGVQVGESKNRIENNYQKPVFISVGSLIPRKNNEMLVKAFSSLDEQSCATLLVLGDGPELKDFEEKKYKNIHFLGNVSNVPDYLALADYFISASRSEGLPNTVLEALSVGLPVLLSDIPSHREITSEYQTACVTFSLEDNGVDLVEKIMNVSELFMPGAGAEAKMKTQEKFSAAAMSSKYQSYYKNLLGAVSE
jgi:glycosyltransferase involved in cell wall biosynthesis